MKFHTSNFAKSASDPNAISIARGRPKFYEGRQFWPLCPYKKHLEMWRTGNMSPDEWDLMYKRDVLDVLDVDVVAKQLGDGAVLCCWEAADDYCHRFQVAKWLKSAGHEVSETSGRYQSPEKIIEAEMIRKEKNQKFEGLSERQKKVLKLEETAYSCKKAGSRDMILKHLESEYRMLTSDEQVLVYGRLDESVRERLLQTSLL